MIWLIRVRQRGRRWGKVLDRRADVQAQPWSVPEQEEKQDYRQRNAEQPKNNSLTHDCLSKNNDIVTEQKQNCLTVVPNHQTCS